MRGHGQVPWGAGSSEIIEVLGVVGGGEGFGGGDGGEGGFAGVDERGAEEELLEDDQDGEDGVGPEEGAANDLDINFVVQ